MKAELHYSPKNTARAIGVSESSVKRWCDDGRIDSVKTVGGHRRVSRADAIAFLKRNKYSLRDPMAIGLPDVRSVSVRSIQDGQRQFLAALRNGDELSSRKLLTHLFVDGHNVAEMFDRIVAPACRSISEFSRHERMDVFQERMAYQVCLQALSEVKTMLPTPRLNAPVAIGADFDVGGYQMPSTAAQMCFSNFGWQADSLGCNLSFDSLYREVVERRPDAVWISLSNMNRPEKFARQINGFCKKVGSEVSVVISGVVLSPAIQNQLKPAACCNSFSQLAMLVPTLKKRS